MPSAEKDAITVLREHNGTDYDEARSMWVCLCGTDLPLDGKRIPFSDHQAAALAAAGLLRENALNEPRVAPGGTDDRA